MKLLSDNIGELHGKRVIVRANFDVPIENGVVGDTTRIEDVISTIELLRQNQCSVVLIAHSGRPDGWYAPESSLLPVKKVLDTLLPEPVELLPFAPDINQVTLPTTGLAMLENIRCWTGEETNDPEFTKGLVRFGEVYVNQAFANCHREHASMIGLPALLDHYAGVGLGREIEMLSKLKTNPQRPFVVVIGGAKLETKEPLVRAFATVADKILVGGKIALDMRDQGNVPNNVSLANLSESGRDIDVGSAEEFAGIIRTAKTILWNGTMGVFEEEENQHGTRIIANAINDTPAFTIVGGGDTETALTVLNMEHGIDYISTGGGAMLTYLSEGTLPALDALE